MHRGRDETVSKSVISASDDRYRDLSDEAGPLEVLPSRMPKLKAAKGSVFN